MKLSGLTDRWWDSQLRLDHGVSFLRRLHRSELRGAYRFSAIAAAYFWEFGSSAERREFMSLTQDELRHADMVQDYLREIGEEVPSSYADDSVERYWSRHDAGIVNLRTAAAAGAYGEVTALNRFRVLVHHKKTPEDMRDLLMRIMVDEQRHAMFLRAVAGEEAMRVMRPYHREGLQALGLSEE